MPVTLEKIASEALQLPPELRAELTDILVGSLETVSPDDDILKAQTEEVIRRWEEIKSGKVETIPGEKVLAEARKLAGR